MKRLLLVGCLLLAGCAKTPSALEWELSRIAERLPEARIGIAVLGPDGTVFSRQDSLLPMLSTFKFPLALAVLEKTATEEISLSAPIDVGPEWLESGTYSPLRDSLPATGGCVTLAALLHYSTSLSDNIACDRLLDLVGGPEAVDRYLRTRGFDGFRIAASEHTMHLDPENQRINVARPSALCALFARFLQGGLLPPAQETFLRHLLESATTGANKLRAGLPEGTVLGHKTGSSDRTSQGIRIAENDAGYVRLPDGRSYCIAVMVIDSPADDAANTALIATISRTVYEYFRKNR